MIKKLPIGISTLSKVIEGDYIYVDKTPYIYEMVNTGVVYFLSRPRRFGKSLLVSTLKELFEGNKELFEGLYIYDKWHWNEKYPVIHLDFGNRSSKSPEQLELSLIKFLNDVAEDYGLQLEDINLLPDKFEELIRKVYEKTGKKVVVLIDEYDKPITDNLDKNDVLNGNQEVLKSFYNVLKGTDEYLRFIFLTGVSKFANVSIFSSLNNLNDITLNDNYSCICGYTHEELKDSFSDYLNMLKDKLSLSDVEVLDKVNYWYDGYSWDGENKVYNPFSTLRLFNSSDFSSYWFETGTPEFLINVLRKSKDYREVLNPITVKQSRFKTFSDDNLDPISLFFQTGYLTIVEKMIINDQIHYKLEFPNFEVESSLLDHLIDLNLFEEKITEKKDTIISYIEALDNDSFQKEMRAFLARIPARLHIEQESYYQSIFISWLYALGFEVEAESPTNTGFSDMVLIEEDFIVVAEFKFSKTNKITKQPIESFDKMLKKAIGQIKDKKYYEKYINKKIIAIGVAFAGKQQQQQ